MKQRKKESEIEKKNRKMNSKTWIFNVSTNWILEFATMEITVYMLLTWIAG